MRVLWWVDGGMRGAMVVGEGMRGAMVVGGGMRGAMVVGGGMRGAILGRWRDEGAMVGPPSPAHTSLLLMGTLGCRTFPIMTR